MYIYNLNKDRHPREPCSICGSYVRKQRTHPCNTIDPYRYLYKSVNGFTPCPKKKDLCQTMNSIAAQVKARQEQPILNPRIRQEDSKDYSETPQGEAENKNEGTYEMDLSSAKSEEVA